LKYVFILGVASITPSGTAYISWVRTRCGIIICSCFHVHADSVVRSRDKRRKQTYGFLLWLPKPLLFLISPFCRHSLP